MATLVYSKGTFTSFNMPGIPNIQANVINSSGQIVTPPSHKGDVSPTIQKSNAM
jgi:hypothetical protein